MKAILENELIEEITSRFPRSLLQINNLQESDAEIVSLGSNVGLLLAATTDSISEEIEMGLYDNAYLIGWMTVMINMSDLAAVGAEPIGIILSEILPGNMLKSEILQIQSGISDACQECNTFVLGGDTNIGEKLVLTGTALGLINKNLPNLRRGCRKGDLLYSSGYLGQGNAFAISKIFSEKDVEFEYRPTSKLRLGKALLGVASTCMDSSDGFIATLDQLMRLNKVGFQLDFNW